MEPPQTATSSIGRAKVLSRTRHVTSARGEAFAILPHQRLKQLHHISRSLIGSSDPETTIATVVGMMDDTVLVRSAVCILCVGMPSSMIWSSDGVSYEQVQAASARALSCFEYLLGPSAAPKMRAPNRVQEPMSRCSGFTSMMDRRRVILLPLAVEHERCLGVLQIEGFERFTEVDLVFISAIASELAVALQRQTATHARHAAAIRESGTVEQQIRLEARGPRSDREAPRARAEHLRAEMARAAAETAQAQARLAATEVRRQYQKVLSNMDRAFIWEADPSTLRLSYLSARGEALLGFPVSRWLEEARFFLHRVHPEDRQLVEQIFNDALRSESPHCEHRMVSSDGHVQWFQTSVHLSCGRGPAAALQGISSMIPCGKSTAEQATLTTSGPEQH